MLYQQILATHLKNGLKELFESDKNIENSDSLTKAIRGQLTEIRKSLKKLPPNEKKIVDNRRGKLLDDMKEQRDYFLGKDETLLPTLSQTTKKHFLKYILDALPILFNEDFSDLNTETQEAMGIENYIKLSSKLSKETIIQSFIEAMVDFNVGYYAGNAEKQKKTEITRSLRREHDELQRFDRDRAPGMDEKNIKTAHQHYRKDIEKFETQLVRLENYKRTLTDAKTEASAEKMKELGPEIKTPWDECAEKKQTLVSLGVVLAPNEPIREFSEENKERLKAFGFSEESLPFLSPSFVAESLEVLDFIKNADDGYASTSREKLQVKLREKHPNKDERGVDQEARTLAGEARFAQRALDVLVNPYKTELKKAKDFQVRAIKIFNSWAFAWIIRRHIDSQSHSRLQERRGLFNQIKQQALKECQAYSEKLTTQQSNLSEIANPLPYQVSQKRLVDEKLRSCDRIKEQLNSKQFRDDGQYDNPFPQTNLSRLEEMIALRDELEQIEATVNEGALQALVQFNAGPEQNKARKIEVTEYSALMDSMRNQFNEEISGYLTLLENHQTELNGLIENLGKTHKTFSKDPLSATEREVQQTQQDNLKNINAAKEMIDTQVEKYREIKSQIKNETFKNNSPADFTSFFFKHRSEMKKDQKPLIEKSDQVAKDVHQPKDIRGFFKKLGDAIRSLVNWIFGKSRHTKETETYSTLKGKFSEFSGRLKAENDPAPEQRSPKR